MKKYVKPDVAFEGFELSQHIAGSCTAMLNLGDVDGCTTTGAGDVSYEPGVFTTAPICSIPTNPDIIQDGCYYTGGQAVVFFKS